jgi:hypothetical protein
LAYSRPYIWYNTTTEEDEDDELDAAAYIAYLKSMDIDPNDLLEEVDII